MSDAEMIQRGYIKDHQYFRWERQDKFYGPGLKELLEEKNHEQ